MNDQGFISFRRQPFSGPIETKRFQPGDSIADIIDRMDLPPGLVPHLGVMVSGREITPDKWGTTCPPRDGVTSIFVRPAGKNSTAIITVVAAVVIAVASYGAASYVSGAMIAAGYGTAAATAAGYAAGAAVALAGSLAMNAIFKPTIPTIALGAGAASLAGGGGGGMGGSGYNNKGDSSQFYAIGGLRNNARPYSAIRNVYGQWRVAPDIAAEPYVITSGDTQTLYGLFDFGYGVIDISDIKIGTTAISRFKAVEYKIHQGYTSGALTLYKNDHVTDSYEVEITEAATVRSTPDSDSNEATIEIGIPQGLVAYGEDGAKSNRIDFQIYYRASGAVTWRGYREATAYRVSTGVKENSADTSAFTLERKRTSAFSFTVTMRFPAVGSYELRIRRSNGRGYLGNDTSTYQEYDRADLTSIRSTKYRLPLRFKTGHTILELQIQSSDQLSGAVDNLSALCKRRLKYWTGTAWATGFTRNPAWVAYDILTGAANPDPIPAARVDEESFKAWAEYCASTAPQGDQRFTCDANMDSASTVYERLMEVLSTARASITMRGGRYGVIWDYFPTVPVQLFTPRNSWGFAGHRAWTKKVHGFKVQWIDPNLGYQQTETIVYNDGFSAANAKYFETISAPYCTRYNQAWRYGRYHLAQGELRPERFTIITDIENLVCERGDLVRVQHDAAKIGGQPQRITAIDGANITTIEPVIVQSGTDYQLLVRTATGGFVEFTVVSQVDAFTLEVTPDPATEGVAVDDLAVFGELDYVTDEFLVKAITPSADLTATLELVPIARAIATADSEEIPDYNPPMTDDDLTPPCLDGVTVSARLVYESRQPYASVVLSWVGVPYAVKYEIWADLDTGEYKLLATTSNTEYAFYEKASTLAADYIRGTVGVIVLPVTAFGTKPPLEECAATEFVPPVDTDPPNKPLFFSGNVSGTSIHLTWLPPDTQDLGGYVLRYSPLLEGATWEAATVERDLLPQDSFSVDVNVRVGTYMLKAIDTSGNYSATAAVVRTTIPDLEGLNLVLTITESPTFPGTLMQVVDVGEAITLDKQGADNCTSFAYGLYTFAETTDLIDILRCYCSGYVEVGGDDCSLISDWALMSDIDPISGSRQDDWDVVLQIRTAATLSFMLADWGLMSDVDPIGQYGTDSDWSGWQTLTAGYYTGRFFQFRAVLTSVTGSAWPVVTGLKVTIDVPDRLESVNDIAIPAGGVQITFPGGAYSVAPAVATTLDNGAAGDQLIITAITTTGFYAEVLDASGTSIAGQMDYLARGYGEILAATLPAVDSANEDSIDLITDALRRTTSIDLLS